MTITILETYGCATKFKWLTWMFLHSIYTVISQFHMNDCDCYAILLLEASYTMLWKLRNSKLLEICINFHMFKLYWHVPTKTSCILVTLQFVYVNVTEKGSIEICVRLCFSSSIYLFFQISFICVCTIWCIWNLCLMVTGESCSVEKELESTKATNAVYQDKTNILFSVYIRKIVVVWVWYQLACHSWWFWCLPVVWI